MNDGILSQEEIDALLKGSSTETKTVNHMDIVLSDFEKDAIGEIGNVSMGTAATTLSTLMQKKVSITTPDVSLITGEQIQDEYPMPYVIIEVNYTEGISGSNVLIVKEEDACIIANLMMGGTGQIENSSLGELELSAVGEAMNQMMGSAATSLSSMFNRRIEIAPPRVTVMHLGKEKLSFPSNHQELVKINFKMEIEDLVNSQIMQIIPMEAARNMIDILIGSTVNEPAVEVSVPPGQTKVTPSAATSFGEQAPAAPADNRNITANSESTSGVKKDAQYVVKPAQFAPLRETEPAAGHQNINLIMDVPLDITVELGRTSKSIKEILELHPGAIIQLDKLAGEPVDMLVNGKLIAKGEVVVIDESYGIRITAILNPTDRMNQLQ